jgi:cold shock protein
MKNTGTVKFYNISKGFGFIKEDQSKREYFFHKTALASNIKDNDKVEFELQQGTWGLNAVNVKSIV